MTERVNHTSTSDADERGPSDDRRSLLARLRRPAEGGAPEAPPLSELLARLDTAGEASEQMELTRSYLGLVGRTRPDDADEEAHRLLHHESSFVRDAASDALLDLPPEVGYRVLDRLSRDEDREVRWYAYEAVASAMSTSAPYVNRALCLLQRGLQDEDFAVRWVATNGLLRIGAASVIPLIEQIARSTPSAPFHEAARRVLSRVTASPELADELNALVQSLGRSTTIVQSPPLATDILARLSGHAGEGTGD